MGLSQSSRINRAIDRNMSVSKAEMEQEIRLGVIGMPGSGRTTLMRQLRYLYSIDDEQSQDENKEQSQEIKKSIMKFLQQVMNEFKEKSQNPSSPEPNALIQEIEPKINEEKQNEFFTKINQPLIETFLNHSDVCGHVSSILDDPLNHDRHGLTYFMTQISRIFDDENPFVPNLTDLLNFHNTTTGAKSIEIRPELSEDAEDEHKGGIVVAPKITCIDPNQNISAIRRWFQILDGVSAIVFTCSLMTYRDFDEKRGKNSLRSAIEVFRETVSKRVIGEEIQVLLFLTFLRSFELSLLEVPITVCFDDFDCGDPEDAFVCLRFIMEQFTGKLNDKNGKHVEIWTHTLDVTNTESVRLNCVEPFTHLSTGMLDNNNNNNGKRGGRGGTDADLF